MLWSYPVSPPTNFPFKTSLPVSCAYAKIIPLSFLILAYLEQATEEKGTSTSLEDRIKKCAPTVLETGFCSACSESELTLEVNCEKGWRGKTHSQNHKKDTQTTAKQGKDEKFNLPQKINSYKIEKLS